MIGQIASRRRCTLLIGIAFGSIAACYSTASIAKECATTSTSGSLRIHAVDSAGQAIPNAEVQVSIWTDEKGFKNNHTYQSDSEGWANVELPTTLQILRVWVRSPGYASMFAQLWPQPQLSNPPLPSEFTYKLTKGTTIGGIVKTDDGQPLAGAKVEVSCESGGEDFGAPAPTKYDIWLATENNTLTTDAQGRWSLSNAPPGNHLNVRLKVNHADYIGDRLWGELQKEQDVTIGQLRDQSATIAMHRGFHVSGQVTDPDGQPVKDAVVIWGDRPYWEDGSQEVRTDANGRYRLGPFKTGPMRVTVAAVGWMPQTRTTQIGPTSSSEDFKLQLGKKLRLKFVDAAGQPVSRVHVHISQWRGAESLYTSKQSEDIDLQIANLSDENGIYEWLWAPDDAVGYTFSQKGYANVEVNITANDSEQLQTIHPIFRIAGTVSDASTGKSLEHFFVVPVIHFRPDFPLLNRNDGQDGEDGRFEMPFDRTDIEHGVQIEAPGYTTFRTDRRYRVGEANPTLDIKLQPTKPYTGKVVDAAAKPIVDARVFVATNIQHLDLHDLKNLDVSFSNNYGVVTKSEGEFEIVPQKDRYALVVISPNGFAMDERAANDLPGELRLQPWAQVKGTVKQAGNAMPKCEVIFEPIELVGSDRPRIRLRLSTDTASDGTFAFDRLPPMACRIQSYLHFSVESRLKSSQSVPLELSPGAEVRLELAGDGAEVVGQFEIEPPRAPFDYHFSLTYLIAKRDGIKAPQFLVGNGFDWRKGWSDSWLRSQEGGVYLNTLHNWFVKPDPDGKFRISGVPAGKYELAVNLYGTTEGCLVHPVAQRVVPIEINADQQVVDLGKVPIPFQTALQVGDMAKNFEFESPDGTSTSLNAQRGKYVFVDFWATWCEPCVAGLPEVEGIHQQFGKTQKLIVVGANLDSETSIARDFLAEHPHSWHHALLGDWSSTDVPKSYGVSTIPAYVLIDPAGRIAAIEHSTEKIRELLDKSPELK